MRKQEEVTVIVDRGAADVIVDIGRCLGMGVARYATTVSGAEKPSDGCDCRRKRGVGFFDRFLSVRALSLSDNHLRYCDHCEERRSKRRW